MPSLKALTLHGFKSFGQKTNFSFTAPVTAIVGPNGSGKSNVAEAFRFVLGEQSLKALRGRRGEDLIWNGASPRAARAAVTVILDNEDRRFPLDFSEITIGREVERDGINNYFLNGERVRWRDVHELLLAGSLPPSGYHLISQGEADRLIAADVVERRELVEEALGLRLYQWKLADSEKKLERTLVNTRQVESLRRELAPHLRFLRREVEKMRQADEWRSRLKQLYLGYLKAETHYWRAVGARERAAAAAAETKLVEARAKLESINARANTEAEMSRTWREAAMVIRQERDQLLARGAELARRRGRLEAAAEFSAAPLIGDTMVPRSRLNDWLGCWRNWLDRLRAAVSLETVQDLLNEANTYLAEWDQGFAASTPATVNRATDDRAALELADWESKHQIAVDDLARRESELESRIESERRAFRDAEAERLDATVTAQTATATLDRHREKSREAELVLAELKREAAEAAALVDREILDFEALAVIDVATGADRANQQRRRLEIEKLKLRLEDLSVGSSDTLKEFEETRTRDEYLAKELADLASATEQLASVRRDLLEKIDREFGEGLAKINQAFQEFFKLMFGGGEAELQLTEKSRRRRSEIDSAETEDKQSGIDIKINLPRKRIKSLEMLSGGERSLVSIALLFAMSRVKPPPFLILDETDAALDESNSRRYGDMIESLAQHSQLILITHNRETMSRAGVIYGVTMNQGGASQLLSIKFDDALSYAKA